MLQGLQDLGAAYWSFMNPLTLLYGLGGAFVGIVMGILPGLSATLCIALLTTLTIKLQANDAILVLICSYVGALYGGSRTAILLNIPGTAANAASCADGYALPCRDRPAARSASPPRAPSSARCSGVVCLALFTPLLAEVALQFGAFEFFWLALFGVTLSAASSAATRSRAG
jgi:putative tricarboxylic transport membrane protein